jgi:hypothetical protein
LDSPTFRDLARYANHQSQRPLSYIAFEQISATGLIRRPQIAANAITICAQKRKFELT